ncbi:sugar transferase [Sporosarcina sp. FSL K6-1522]|uniref:sugar transferase n=1 Tax=Sporosarcina sp. FSL K6-1522 TaxID=2921554 RepID=UPI00315B2839
MEKLHRRLDVRTPIMYRYHYGKRIFDIVSSLLLLICLLPLLILLSIAIILFSGRPVFFAQSRTGIDNKPFTIFKFRTMKATKQADSRHQYEWQEGVPDNFLFKTADDVAVTAIGKILRKYSLDELPQLLNVLIGNMSIVGPRPEIPEITNLYSNQQAKRLLVKPGITGYAQVNGRSEINHGKKIAYDLYYVNNRSLLLDFKIIRATIVTVIKGKGAY